MDDQLKLAKKALEIADQILGLSADLRILLQKYEEGSRLARGRLVLLPVREEASLEDKDGIVENFKFSVKD